VQPKLANPQITAVVPVFNRREDLQRLLKSFSLLRYEGILELIVVDDASTIDYSGVYQEFKNLCPHISLQVIVTPKTSGPAVARNMAIEAIDDGIVWFLDSDAEIFQASMLNTVVDIFDNDPEIKVIGGEVLLVNGASYIMQVKRFINEMISVHFVKFDDFPAEYRKTVGTNNFFIHRKTFDGVGRFDIRLKTHEDTELCFRISAKGYKLFVCKETGVYHHKSPEGRDNSTFDFFKNLINYAKAVHKNRIFILALHRRSVLPFLPIIDVFYGLRIFLVQFRKKHNAGTMISRVKKKKVSLMHISLCHFWGMLNSYGYAYKVMLLGKL
jgi:GT2 family glycosyltransferase